MTVYNQNMTDSFASKHGLMVELHKPKCPLEILVCCGQGQGHGKGSFHF